MAVNKYLRGRVIRVSAEVLNDAGAAVNPSAMSLIVKEPDGTETTYIYGTDAEVIRPSTGNFYADITGASAGRYYYRWESTDPDGAAEGEFQVTQGAFD